MNRTAEVVATVGIAMTVLTGSASAQTSPGSAAIDSSLNAAIERKNVPGVVARSQFQSGAFLDQSVVGGKELGALGQEFAGLLVTAF